MSGQGQGNPDGTLWVFAGFMIVLVALVFAAQYYAPLILVPWKFLRALELCLIFQFDAAWKVVNYEFVDYGKSFSMVNDKVWTWYQFLAIPMLWKSWVIYQNSTGDWSMEHYLQNVWRRFPWLNEIFKVNEKTFQWSTKPPFFKILKPIDFFERDWPSGMEPLDYLEKYRDRLSAEIKDQMGPLIQWKDRQIVWKDKWAQRVAEQCFKRIPDGKAKPGDPPWKEQAWKRCAENHRYERTFALGMLAEVRNFGVYAAPEFLYIRTAAIEDLKKGDTSSFIMWRAINAFGGNTAFPEAMGVVAHYMYEKSLTQYLRNHPEDKAIVFRLRSRPSHASRMVEELKKLEDIAMTTRKTG